MPSCRLSHARCYTCKYRSCYIDCRYRRLQTSNDCRLGELQSDVKLKAFEQERTSMMYEDTTRALKESQLNSEKLQKKLEVTALSLVLSGCDAI